MSTANNARPPLRPCLFPCPNRVVCTARPLPAHPERRTAARCTRLLGTNPDCLPPCVRRPLTLPTRPCTASDHAARRGGCHASLTRPPILSAVSLPCPSLCWLPPCLLSLSTCTTTHAPVIPTRHGSSGGLGGQRAGGGAGGKGPFASGRGRSRRWQAVVRLQTPPRRFWSMPSPRPVCCAASTRREGLGGPETTREARLGAGASRPIRWDN